MEHELKDFEKINIVYGFIDKITNDLAEAGAIFYDVVIEETIFGEVFRYPGKAFSIDGKNIFGFTYDENNKKFRKDGSIIANRAFAGSYVEGKGLTAFLLPNINFYLSRDNIDLTINATNRPDRTKLHGKFWCNFVRVDIKPETEEISAETHLNPFIDHMASMVNVYTDKSYELALKGLSQEENLALIDKIYEQFKDIPIPSCFADDGTGPKTKI